MYREYRSAVRLGHRDVAETAGRLGHDAWMHAVVDASHAGSVPMADGTRVALADTTVTLSHVMVADTVAVVVMHSPVSQELQDLCTRAARTIAPTVVVVLLLPE